MVGYYPDPGKWLVRSPEHQLIRPDSITIMMEKNKPSVFVLNRAAPIVSGKKCAGIGNLGAEFFVDAPRLPATISALT